MSKKTNKNKVMSKRLKTSLVSTALLFGAITGNANAARVNISDSIDSPEALLKFQEQMARASEKDTASLLAGNIKMQAMYDYSKSVAIRAAMTSRLANIDGVIAKHSRELDAIYNFQPLMIQQRVVPPVITEARDIYNQSGKLQIRLSKALYDIISQAYFSSNPPNWREYLKFSNEGTAYGKFAYVGGDMQPKNAAEKQIWAAGTADGWNLGARQANVVLEQAMDRLNRDYTGMIRFHTLVLEGKITMPSISAYNLYDTNSGSRLTLGEELLQIDVLPTFKDQMKIGGGAGLRNERQLNTIGNRVETPKALDRAPIKEVYDVVSNVRNGEDITNKPWKDALPLSNSKNPLERPVTINIQVKQTFKAADTPSTSYENNPIPYKNNPTNHQSNPSNYQSNSRSYEDGLITDQNNPTNYQDSFVKPVVIPPPPTAIELTDQQLKWLRLEPAKLPPKEPPLRSYESPLR